MECRYYDKPLPEVDDIILVQVKSLSDIGAYVSLLEFGKVEGMVQISEMSSRRIRSISKLTKVGNVEVVSVLRVDADRGYIDLSKKRIANEDVLKAKELFARNKTVHGIMRHIATIVNHPVEDVCRAIAWPLYKEFGSQKPYDLLRHVVNDNSIEVIAKACGESLLNDQELVDALLVAAGRKLTPHEVRVRAVFDCTCYTTDGVVALRESLLAVKQECANDQISMKLISAPQFLMETVGIGKEACVARILKALALVEKNITARGGNFKLRCPPEVIGLDEEELPKFDDMGENASSDEESESVEKSDGEEEESESESSSSSDSD